jgi:hypothetical protein
VTEAGREGHPAYEYRSARRFANPSPLFRWADAHGYFLRPGKALVFGAGLLVEANELSGRGWKVDALETSSSIDRRRQLYTQFEDRPGCRVLATLDLAYPKYRIITATHVLEFIEDSQIRDELLRSLANRLAKTGHLLISLRGWSDVRAAKTAKSRGDGVVTGLGTWTRGYTIDEANEFIKRAGIRAVASPHGLRAKAPEQVRLVCQR